MSFHMDGDYDDENMTDELALSELLKDDVVFCNSREYYCSISKTVKPSTIVLFVNCSDVFAWGCADGEEFTTEDIPVLYKMHKENKTWGSVKWCCIKRNEQPQKSIKKSLQKCGVWDDVLEALPENQYDKHWREVKQWDI